MERGKHRDEWRRLCEARIEDAAVLLKSERYDAAYYLAGYAVECALKATIASLVKSGEFPPTADYVRNYVYTHSLARLSQTAELTALLEKEPVREHWGYVKDWEVTARYDSHGPEKATRMLESVRQVVECLRQYW